MANLIETIKKQLNEEELSEGTKKVSSSIKSIKDLDYIFKRIKDEYDKGMEITHLAIKRPRGDGGIYNDFIDFEIHSSHPKE